MNLLYITHHINLDLNGKIQDMSNLASRVLMKISDPNTFSESSHNSIRKLERHGCCCLSQHVFLYPSS